MRCSRKWGPLVGARSPVLVAANTLPVLVFLLLPFPFFFLPILPKTISPRSSRRLQRRPPAAGSSPPPPAPPCLSGSAAAVSTQGRPWRRANGAAAPSPQFDRAPPQVLIGILDYLLAQYINIWPSAALVACKS